MRDSFSIGRVFDIEIRVHYLFPLILAFLVASAESPLGALLLVLLLFGVVFLHEMGHSLAAQAFGIQVLDITFWPLGGMARMAELPEKPRVEGLVAIAGPAVNGVLFTAGLALHILLGQVPRSDSLLGYFVIINLMMGLFNLIPAFPMDGGRILRAWLARKRDWVRATEIAVKVGRVFSLGMIIAGPLLSNYILLFIGVWVWWMGSRELWYVNMRSKARSAYEEVIERSRYGQGERMTADELRDLESYRGQLKDYERDD